jgi:hypothetical protein
MSQEMTLIIRDRLVNPPTWFSSFRDLTLYCHIFLKDDVLIESDDPDPYYRWMRSPGGWILSRISSGPARRTGSISMSSTTTRKPS